MNFDYIKKINSLLTSKERSRSIVVLLYTFLNSILDVISLALLLPLIGLCFNSQLVQNNGILRFLFNYFNFQSSVSFTLFVLIVVLGVFVLKALLSVFIQVKIQTFTYAIAERITEKNFNTFYELNLDDYSKTNSMLFFREIRNSPPLFANYILLTVVQLVSEIIVMLLILIGLILADYRVLLIFGIIILPLLILFYGFTKQKIKTLEKGIWDLDLTTAKQMNEAVLAFIDVILLNKKRHFISNFLKTTHSVNALNLKKNIYGILPSKILEIVAVLGILILFVFTTYIYDSSIEQMFTLLTVFAIAAYRLLPSVNRILVSILTLNQNQSLLNDLVDFDKRSFDTSGNSKTREKQIEISFNHQIELKLVGFKYDSNARFQLHGVSFSIQKGKTIGIIGKSGSGKTTLINILLRFLIETEGSINVDGNKLSAQNKVSWRRKIAYIPQNIYILDSSLKENIAFGEEHCDDEKLQKVIALAQLSALVSSWSNGIETQLGEHGAQISGGQKQRIGIARALYRDSEVLILDEATNALDIQTELEINETIKNLKSEQVTVIIVAHRISTLENCDQIFELSNGQLSAEYSYSQLVEKNKF